MVSAPKTEKNQIQEVVFYDPIVLLWRLEKDPVACMAPSGQKIVLLYPLMLTWPEVTGGTCLRSEMVWQGE